jgi:Xaa-Pro aminopeptidase
MDSGDPSAASPLLAPGATLVPATETSRRLAALQGVLAARGLDAALLLQNADLYYFSGTVQRSFLYVPAVGEATLFVRKLVERARLESPLAAGVELADPRDLPAAVAARHGRAPARRGLELDVLPVAEFRRLERLFPAAETHDVGRDLMRLRAVKSAWEIARQRAAAALTTAVYEHIPGILREGLTEVQFAGLVEAEARRLGHEGVIRMRGFNQEMFYGQLLTGVSGTAGSFMDTPLAGTGLSAAVAQGVSFRRIGRGEPVVFDFVAVREGYITDFTRMFSLGGLPAELTRAYAVALRIEAEVTAMARPGVTCRTLYETAVAAAADEGLAGQFMGHGASQVRFIGHGVGLELDELPVLAANDLALEPGMVFALEPKFVLPGLGAIGVENTWLVTETGLEVITEAPEHIVVVGQSG